jgi:hypothetical protein
MAKKKAKKELPIIALNEGEREKVWDDLFVKEEGIIIEFHPDSNTGKIQSLDDGGVYEIDSRDLLRKKIALRPQDKVLFAPFEDPEGNDYARVIRVIELKA